MFITPPLKRGEVCASPCYIKLKPVLAAQQRQHRIRQRIGLGQHGHAGLLQDLAAGQRCGFRREVRILNPAASSGEVFRRGLQAGDRRAEAVLVGTQIATRSVDLGSVPRRLSAWPLAHWRREETHHSRTKEVLVTALKTSHRYWRATWFVALSAGEREYPSRSSMAESLPPSVSVSCREGQRVANRCRSVRRNSGYRCCCHRCCVRVMPFFADVLEKLRLPRWFRRTPLIAETNAVQVGDQ